MASSLQLEGIGKHYGALRAVDDVTLTVEAGSRHALIGPNGAGKSTLFKLITGEVPATTGSLRLDGTDIGGYAQPRRSRAGISQTYQHSSVFGGLTLGENVALAARRQQGRERIWWRSADRIRGVDAVVEESLGSVGLAERVGDVPASLSHGERRQLELAIVLATRPRVLLLDEPTAGMSAAESWQFVRLVQGLDPELTVVVVEHDLDVVFELATHISVLHLGRLLATGTPDAVAADPAVQEAYLAWQDQGDATLSSAEEVR